ncbi:MAG: hypothetical protein M3P44_13040 [Actinomycetota bacterium]|nr:hypothetical protein [Actinomycetota bacterium]
MRGIASIFIAVLCLCAFCAGPAAAQDPPTGGAAYGVPDVPVPTTGPPGAITAPATAPTTPEPVGQVVDGIAFAPESAPQPVKDAIAAANGIVGKPYVYGGGHNTGFRGRGYDCSGTVSFALHGGALLTTPLDSGSFMRWGSAGAGDWVTVYSNPGHAFAVIAGMRLDTSAAGDPSGSKGPRWRPNLRSTSGYRARHPAGL